jgi:hypothetical protein
VVGILLVRTATASRHWHPEPHLPEKRGELAMNRHARFTLWDFAPSRLRSPSARRRLKRHSPVFEGLEDRAVPSTIQWNTTIAPSGGDWDNPINWQGGVVPGASDIAEIEGFDGTVYHSTSANDSVLALIDYNAVSVNNGSLTIGSAPSEIDSTLSVSGTGTLRFNNSTVNGRGTLIDGNKLIASNSTFALSGSSYSGITLTSGSRVKSGDLTNNVFNTPLTVPITDVPLLSSNQSFQEVDLTGGLESGQAVTLTPLGTQPANQYYVLPNGLTVSSGATLTVATGAVLQISLSQTLTDNGTLAVTGASLELQDSGSYTQPTEGITVNNGGVMTASGSSFINPNNVNSIDSVIQVNPGGHLTASNSTFAWDNFGLAVGSILDSGDLTSNVFNTTLTAPVTDVPLLTNNQSFQEVDLIGGLAKGQAVTLLPLGTQSTANQFYALPKGLTVATGAMLTIGPSASVDIRQDQTLAVSGQLDVIGASVSTDDINFSSTTYGIAVNNGGTMVVSGSSFTRNGNGQQNASVQVNAGGHLTASNSTFALDSLGLNSASNDQLAVNVFATQVDVNSGAHLSVTGNDFSNSKVVAAGGATATINLGNNYWGSTNAAEITANQITDHTTNSNLPTVQLNPLMAAPSTPGAATNIVAFSTSGIYNAYAPQSVTLSASLTSGGIQSNEGSVTFLVVNGASMFGNPVTANVANGSAKATILLPAGTRGGPYTLVAIYNGTANFIGSLDASHSVMVNPAPATTTAAAASDIFGALAAQTVNLSATVTSANGPVNEGTETFTILAGSSPIGSPVTVPVVNGAASASYTVPAGTRAGTYTIKAVYNGTADFQPASDTTHVLTVSPAATTSFAVNTSTTYSGSAQAVTLKASITSTDGTVNEGSVTFTILNGLTSIGQRVTVPVVNGVASASYTLPAGLAGGTYTIKAVYDGGLDFATSTDTAHTLTVNPAATTITAGNVTTKHSSSAQTVTLTAKVSSPAGAVGEGSVTFLILKGTTVIGTATTGNIVDGVVSVKYTIPANTAAGSYTIKAIYSGTAEFLAATEIASVLTITA